MPSTARSTSADSTGDARRRSTRAVVAVLASVALAAGCSGDVSFSIGGQSVEDAAVELIEGELADGIGLGELEADCPEVPDPEVGTEFGCTATTPDGAVIDFAGTVDREDHIDVETTNVIVADALGTFEAAGIDLVNETEGAALDASAMDCGDASIVIPADGAIDCTLTDPSSGELYDATYTITDLSTGAFSLEWTPRA
jgi:hypothetical protein